MAIKKSEVRFPRWVGIAITDADEKKCVMWNGAKNNKGYGLCHVRLDFRKYRVMLVHRMAYQAANPAEAIAGKLILHRCDVRLCINPKHLFSGTAQDNTDDMMRKGRWKVPSHIAKHMTQRRIEQCQQAR